MHRPPLRTRSARTRTRGALAALALSGFLAAQAGDPPPAAFAPRFVLNAGQWPEHVRFAVLGGHTLAYGDQTGFALALQRRAGDDVEGGVVRFSVVGADDAEIRGEGPPAAPARFISAAAQRSAAAFGRLRLAAVRPGVDLVLRPDAAGGALAYDLWLEPGADLDSFEIACAGATLGEPRADGSLPLLAEVPGGTVELVQRTPVAWVETSDGARRAVEVRFERRGDGRFGFTAEGWNGDETLVVDPGLTWSGFLGGGASDAGLAVVHAPGDGVFVGGWAGSTDFPTTAGAYRTAGDRDGFVAKLSENGQQLLWSTYFGGRDTEEVRALALAPGGDIVLGGFTTSPDLPVTSNAFQRLFAGGSLLGALGDGFVARLSGDGSTLRWCTYLGRFGDDFVEALHVMPNGEVIAAGHTDADTFPTTPGVVQETFGSINTLASDVFVSRLRADGSDLVWSTYFGAGGQELLGGMRVDASGRVLFGGLTASFPPRTLPDAYAPSAVDPWNGFVAVLSADARRLEAATLIGIDTYDRVEDVAFGADGSLLAVGRANVGAQAFESGWQLDTRGEEDAFVVRLSADGRALRAATFFGGNGDDVPLAMALADDGGVLVVGATSSTDLPAIGDPLQGGYAGGASDAFVARFSSELGEVRSLGVVGGVDKDRLQAVARSGADAWTAVGTTFSGDFPAVGVTPQTTFGGMADACVVRVAAPVAPAPVEVRPVGDAVARAFVAGDALTGAAFELRNLGADHQDVEAITFVVGGSADLANDLSTIAVHVDIDADGALGPGDPRVGEPRLLADTGRIVRVPTTGLALAANGTLSLLAGVTTRPGCAPGAEIAVGLLAPSRIEVRAQTDGRRVAVASTGNAVRGRTWFCEARRGFEGDLDGDGSATCRDVRWLAQRLGSSNAALQLADADGDGVIGTRDVELLLDRVVGREPTWLPQAALEPGGCLVVRGFDLPQAVTASVDGRALEMLLVDERFAVFALPELGPGRRVVRVEDGGGVELVRGELPVQ